MSEIWKLEQQLCRCCHAEGAFENLSKPRELNGITEIYSNMLKACFQIVIDSVPGPLNDMTYAICESCVLRLRDAYEFMRQVQNAEIKFKDYYNRNAIKGIHEDCDNDGARKTEENDCFSDHEECTLDDDFFMHFNNEDLQNSATKEKGKTKGTKIRKVKKSREVKKVINKLKKAKKKVDNEKDASEDQDDDVLSLINFTIIRNDDGIVFHNCNICKKNYLTRGAFTKHYRKIHLEIRVPPRSCHLCSEKVSKHTKALHLEEKHGIPAPTCNICERKFSFPHEVLCHKRLQHTGDKKYRCDECGQLYASKIILKNHLLLHSAGKNFICQFCNKTLRTEIGLRLHIRVHLNVRPHICDVCNKSFTQEGSLRHHIKMKHSI
ncbi:PREDICTED: GDNF-inducible zinc finger protein 1-like isoform X4 [Papilio polytes]|uniref:GDNF-inducible zinc finger protein 1-like isoform X4 n=1 Tax=Papilio polytes TaxID=76194 RepID=UPI0006765724|nr:PREDICTED: GDNF-inducible zinc finger protein 1-like isoform X4 [Papilio polytes]